MKQKHGSGLNLKAIARKEFSAVSQWLPILIGVAVSTATLFLWQALVAQERAQIQKYVELAAESVNKEIEERMEPRILALVQMAERWGYSGKPPQNEWEFEAGLNIRHLETYQAIQWVDPSFHARWIVPLAGNEKTKNLYLGFEKQRRETLVAARNRREAIATPSINLVQGGRGFQIYAPIFRGQKFDGFIAGVFRTQALLDAIMEDLEEEDKAILKYSIAVFEGDEKIYDRRNNGQKDEYQAAKNWGQETETDLYRTTWRVLVWPRPELLAEERSLLPETALIGGLSTAFLLTWVVYLAQRARQRAWKTEMTNRELDHEIRERQQVEEALHLSLATNSALLDTMPDLIVHLSKDGTFVNYKLPKDMSLPVPASEFLGKTLYEVLPVEVAQPAIDCIERALQTSNRQLFEFQLFANSNLQDYEARIVVSAKNEVIAIVRDITERKRVEENTRKALEKERELSELKSRFVTTTSHEFRTPLATILSSAELLQHYSHKWGVEKKLIHLQRIQVAVKQMTQLLNDVLLIGKAEAGKLEFNPSPLDLAQFCRDLVEEMQISTVHPTDSYPAHSILFCSQGQCTNTCMDEKLLRHILINLLSNAIKYSPKGETVYFDLVCDQGEAIFQVRDEGIGIPAEDQAKLFDSFHRASNVGMISGTGLGLTIVKKSTDLHGGTIAVESKVGMGSTFTVTLPLNKQV